jgi:hypothetical protein
MENGPLTLRARRKKKRSEAFPGAQKYTEGFCASDRENSRNLANMR